MPRYHAILTCSGLTESEAATAPAEVLAEFAHRPWHSNVTCRWDGRLLWLEADNEYDARGEALFDDFWNVIRNIRTSGTVQFEIVSVNPISDRV